MAAKKVGTLLSVAFDGCPDGMNAAIPPHEIADTQAAYLQDIILNQPGYTRRRGPVQAATGVATFTNPVFGGVTTLDPASAVKVALLEGTVSNAYVSVLSTDHATATQLPWTGGFTTTPYPVVEARGALLGGAWIGTSTSYTSASPTQALGLWRGGSKAAYTTGTVTVSRGATAVTGSGTSWTSNVSSGMFLFNGSTQLVGVVKSVDSNTAITLEKPALVAIAGAAYTLQSLRGINPRVVKGRITGATSAATVAGSNTKFKDQGLDSGTWDLYRARDLTFIGTVTSVTNNTSLTLTGNCAIALSEERYVAIQRDGDYTLPTTVASKKVGFLTAVYAQLQFFANLGIAGKTNYLWFSDDSDPEAIDLSATDGDFIPITSGTTQSPDSPIKALVPSYNSLLILKENEAFGLFGASPEQFEVRKVLDDGVLSGMSAQPYRGGVIFAGRNGIYNFDGVQATNMTSATLGQYYQTAVAGFDPAASHMWGMVVRDHYFLFIEDVSPPRGITKGTVTTTPTRMTIVVNLTNNATTLFTNVDIRGSLTLPAQTGLGPWYFVNTASGGRICDAIDLFDDQGNDTLTCSGSTIGPDFYLESKKYSMGSPVTKKQFKHIQLHYQAGSAGLLVDTVPGLNNTGATASTSFPASAYTWDTLSSAYTTWDALAAAFPNWDALVATVWFTRRATFRKRDYFLGFRLYQSSSTVSRVTIGPWSFAFKYLRGGRS